MIQISITGRNARVIRFTSIGHASLDSGTKGNNLICCAVGILVQSLYLFCKKENLLTKETVSEGELDLEFILENQNLLVNAIDLVLTGLENLQKQYADEIKIVYDLNEVKHGT